MDQKIFKEEEINLLNRVKDILDFSRVLKKVRKEDFNIFEILRKRNDEDNLHSAFLKDLLSPSGSHGMGDKFLRTYIEYINNDRIDEDLIEAVIVKKEESLVSVAGRADITINNGKQVIIIENKIGAQDQYFQLARYKSAILNELKPIEDRWLLVYLNPYGEEPSDQSLGIHEDCKFDMVDQNEFITQSYHKDILKWLEECHRLSADHPTLREVIKQYMSLLKKMTGQDLDNQTNEKLDKIIMASPQVVLDIIRKSKKEYEPFDDNNEKEIESTYLIECDRLKSRFKTNKELISLSLFSSLFREINEKLSHSNSWEFIDELDFDTYSGFKICKPEWPKDFWVSVQAQSRLYESRIILGIQADKRKLDRAQVKNCLRDVEIPLETYSKAWPTYHTLLHFGDDDEIIKLFDEPTRNRKKSEMKTEILDLLEKAERLNLDALRG